MKTKNSFKTVLALFVTLILLLYASPGFSDNKVDIQVSNVSIISPGIDTVSSRLLFKFDLPASLSDKRIDYAEVVFYAKIDTLSRHSVLFAGYPVTTDWIKTTATWSNPWTKNGSDFNDSLYEIGMIKAKGDGKVRFDITRLVERWQQGSIPNYGIIIIPLEEGRKIKGLMHPSDLPPGIFAKVRIYFSYTHP
jgi:hypothetical protein